MYKAKRQGKGRYEVFEPSMHAQALERLEMEAGLRRAIERDEFVVHYQPTILLATGQMVGVEALVRWQDPERGLIAPGDFIPLAEDTGLILPIGRWVLEQACEQAQLWHEALPGHVPLTHERESLGQAVSGSRADRTRCRAAEHLAAAAAESGPGDHRERDDAGSAKPARARCARSRPWACCWPWTTLGRAIRRWATCSASRSTSSRLTSRLSTTSPIVRTAQGWHGQSSNSARRSGCALSPRVSSIRIRRTC